MELWKNFIFLCYAYKLTDFDFFIKERREFSLQGNTSELIFLQFYKMKLVRFISISAVRPCLIKCGAGAM